MKVYAGTAWFSICLLFKVAALVRNLETRSNRDVTGVVSLPIKHARLSRNCVAWLKQKPMMGKQVEIAESMWHARLGLSTI